MTVRCDKFFCFRPATMANQDLKETEPVNEWEQWESLGFRFGCDKHPPPPAKKIRLTDGQRLDYIYGKGHPYTPIDEVIL